MRVVFMGTPEFAVPSFDVVADEHELLLVVTQPDRPKGRGQQMSFSPIKEQALKYKVNIRQPEKVNNPELIQELRSLKPDVIVVVAFGQKIPQAILDLPPHGCVNVHSSLLPALRGSSPINRAIVDGYKFSGVTTMYLCPQWDAGDIILQTSEEILPSDTAGSLHDRLMVKGAELLGETLRQLAAGTAPRIPQDHEQATYAMKLSKEDGQISWEQSAVELERLVRGMNPWPVAYTYYQDEVVKVYEAEAKAMGVAGTGKPGEVVGFSEAGVDVATRDGILCLKTVQRQNSRRVSGRDFANGIRLTIGDRFSTNGESHADRN